MKKLSAICLALLLAGAAEAKTVKTTFEVQGNCGMCQSRIEKAAKAVKGVLKAQWNKQTGVLTLVYENRQTSLEQVQQAIAKAGHDNGSYKADLKTYNALPGCCKYRAGHNTH